VTFECDGVQLEVVCGCEYGPVSHQPQLVATFIHTLFHPLFYLHYADACSVTRKELLSPLMTLMVRRWSPLFSDKVVCEPYFIFEIAVSNYVRGESGHKINL